MTTPSITSDTAPNANIGRIYYLEAVVSPNTPIASPASFTWPLEDNYLERIDVRIPPGPSGAMGFRILWSQQQIVPWGNYSWLIANDEEIPWKADTAISASGLVVQAYNLGNFPHTIYLKALVRTLSPATAAAVSALTGSVALPASQVGPENYTANQYVAPIADNTEASIESETNPELETEQEPIISPDMSLVAVS